MKTTKRTYYTRTGPAVTEVTRIRIDGVTKEGNNAPPEPIFWQHPYIGSATLYGCDGDIRHSTEIECLIRYTLVAGYNICLVQEAGSLARNVFTLMDERGWIDDLEDQIAIWLAGLYGGTPERPLFPPTRDAPPPDEIDQLVGLIEAVPLIDGDLANNACPIPLNSQDSASPLTPTERCRIASRAAGRGEEMRKACAWDELQCPGCPYRGVLRDICRREND